VGDMVRANAFGPGVGLATAVSDARGMESGAPFGSECPMGLCGPPRPAEADLHAE